ncbi:Tetratricopeptide repeat protein 14 [Thoreauomyces humboldtii]|nr:Tetratricopeptide repeat protein 14 [Thoreauomyces humboldtii]
MLSDTTGPVDYIFLRQRQEAEYARLQVKEGIEAFQAQDYERALRKYKAALEQDPRCVDAYVARGALWAKQEKYSKAVKEFRKALALDPDHNNANVYLKMTQTKLAEIEREKESAASGEFLMPVDFDPRKSVISVDSVIPTTTTSVPERIVNSIASPEDGTEEVQMDPDRESEPLKRKRDASRKGKKVKKKKKKKSSRKRDEVDSCSSESNDSDEGTASRRKSGIEQEMVSKRQARPSRSPARRSDR